MLTIRESNKLCRQYINRLTYKLINHYPASRYSADGCFRNTIDEKTE